MNKLVPYLEQYALLAMEKRNKLLRLTEGCFLELDLDAGTARFSETLAFPFQVLGTESENSFTWLWAWAEEQTEMPGQLMRSAREMKAWLEQNGLGEFARPSLDLDAADGSLLSCLAAEVCRASSFHRDPYEGGALYLLLFGSQIDGQPGFARSELVSALLELGARYPVSHRNALAAYLRSRAGSLVERPDSLQALLPTGEQIIAEFDPDGSVRLVNGAPVT